jgi:hypothetical protein
VKPCIQQHCYCILLLRYQTVSVGEETIANMVNLPSFLFGDKEKTQVKETRNNVPNVDDLLGDSTQILLH